MPGGSYSNLHFGTCAFLPWAVWQLQGRQLSMPKGMLWVERENELPFHDCPTTLPYLLADKQAVGVLDGGSLMQQQRLELALLDVTEGIEHHSQELERTSMEPWLSSERVCRAQGSSSAPRQGFHPATLGALRKLSGGFYCPEWGQLLKAKDRNCCSLHISLLKALSMGFPQAPLLSSIAGPWLARGQARDFNPRAASSYHGHFFCESQLPVRFQKYEVGGWGGGLHACQERTFQNCPRAKSFH